MAANPQEPFSVEWIVQLSASEQAMVSLYESGLSISDVAQRTGISLSTVWRRLGKHGVIRPRSPIPKGEDAARRDREIVRLYETGLSQCAIAAQLGIGQTTVSRRLKALGVLTQRRSYDPVIRAANLAKVNEAKRIRHEPRDGVVGKACSGCSEWRPLNKFGPHKLTSDGLESRCNDCMRHRSRKYHQANRTAISAKRCTEAYRTRFRPYHREWERQKRASDVNYRITKALRVRLNKTLKGKTKAVSTLGLVGCTLAELRAHLEAKFVDGMSWETYGRPGWEIDHIRPCSSFDLSDPQQQKDCFHYSNLQPLWGIDNWRKGPR